MFRNRDEQINKRNKAIFGVVIGVSVVFLIVLMVVLIPKRKMAGPGSLFEDRIECPGFEDSSSCSSKGCVYESGQRGPSCYMKRDSFGYSITNTTEREDGQTVNLRSRSANTPYGPSLLETVFVVTYITENIVRVQLLDSNKERYEVPVQKEFPLLQQKPTVDTKKLAYSVTVTKNSGIFAFQIKRTDGTVLWDTRIGGLVLSDQFLQIASYLPSKNVYGLGEHTHTTFRHDMEYKTWPMFARDRPPVGGEINLYGVHPFYTCLEKSTKSHGVLLLNSNAMDVTLMPAPAISFRTVGGILDLFYFVGDNPEHVVQLYTSLVGRPVMPPYWGLGFQLSRYGYNNLSNVQVAVERTRAANIAQDVQFLDIDHMNARKDFTYDEKNFAGLIEYVKKTQEEYGLKWIIILDPAIPVASNYGPYESGLKDGVFIKRSPDWKADMFPAEVRDHNVTFGKVWPDEIVAFPDFFLGKTKQWWINTIVEYHKVLPFDGLWIDMNEPANFGTNEERPFYCQTHKPTEVCWSLKCPHSPLEDPPYNPLKKSGSGLLSTMTLCMDSLQSDSYRHYDVHSLYGWSQSQPTLKAAEQATGTRSLVISRSTYPSSGQYTGHWLGDNKSTWEDLRNSIIGMLEFNLFGFPYIGADVCGFFGDTTEELCMRWMQLGAFYPFYRNHNGNDQKDQDPGIFGAETKEASRKAVERRYILQPYLYTLFHRAHVDGNTVVRPLFHEFPGDEKTFNIGEQFMWGKCLLVSPILKKGEKSVSLYLPKDEWWHFKYQESQQEKVSGGNIVKSDVSDNIPVHVRGGSIIPTEPYQLKQSGKNPAKNITLYVFPKKDSAFGEVFIDDGLSKDTVKNKAYLLYQFTYKNCSITVERKDDSKYSGEEPILGYVHVFKVKDATKVTSSQESLNFSLDSKSNVLSVEISKNMKDISKISWQDKDEKCQMLS